MSDPNYAPDSNPEGEFGTGPNTVNQAPSKAPVTKVAAAGIGGAITTIIVAIIEAVGGDVSPELAAGIATVVAFAAGYIAPPRGG